LTGWHPYSSPSIPKFMNTMSHHADRSTNPKPRQRALILFFAPLAAVLLIGCSKSSDTAKTPEVQPQPISTPSLPVVAQSTPTPASAKEFAPPKTEEVNEAVMRVFKRAATINSNYTPSVLVGDFNGDGSEDIAIAVKPNPEALAEINSEFANWALEDVKQAEQAAKPAPVKAERTDTLIAIIHGVGAKGWRNPEARQTFLLRNAAGTKPAVESPDKTSASRTSPNPTPRGDVIKETINGQHGTIYWNGARYALRLSAE
jgi:hypothetical protein